jgi:ankyrin repeat protein
LYGCSDIILGVIQNKDTVIDATDKEGRTPLYMAAENGHVLIVGMLLNNGANPNIKTKEGVTAAEAAEQQRYRKVTKQLEIISQFLNHPDNHTIKPSSNKTLLYFAVEKGEKQLVKMLVKYVYPVEHDIVDLAIKNGDEQILRDISKRAHPSISGNRVRP